MNSREYVHIEICWDEGMYRKIRIFGCGAVLEILGRTQIYMHRLAAHELPPDGLTVLCILVDLYGFCGVDYTGRNSL